MMQSFSYMQIDEWSCVCRILAACFVGMIMGIDRHLQGKSAGLRTHALVAIASSGIAMVGIQLEVGLHLQSILSFNSMAEANALSRVIQGVLQGIGFLGAGVIMQGRLSTDEDITVHGLTTAASIWLTAILGIMSGLGMWLLLGVSMLVVFLVLVLGGRIERFVTRKINGKNAQKGAE